MSQSSSSSEEKNFYGPQEFIVEEHPDSEDSSIAGSSEDEEITRRQLTKAEIPPQYWHIQKLVKYLKIGNQTATVIALCCLKDHDLTEEINQYAIQDIGGLEVLINLLETKDLKCRLGALSVLRELSKNLTIRRCMTNLGGVPLLVKNLEDPARDLQILVGETIHNVAKIKKARKHVRKANGIPKLVDLLDVKEKCIDRNWNELDADEKELVQIATAAAKALWSISASRKNVLLMMNSGVVPLLARLIKSPHMEMVTPTVGCISRCASESTFQLAIETEGMMQDIVKHLSYQNTELKRFCSETIFKCAVNPVARNQVREAGGLDPLISMVREAKTKSDKPLFAAVTGAIWKCAISPENVKRFDQLRTVQTLVGLLENVEENETVLSNVVGALSECLRLAHNRENLQKAGGIPRVVNLLNYTYPPLLENVPKVLCESAKDEDSMRIIEDLDGVRLIWSLLKNPSPKVQASACRSLVPCVRNALDSGEMVRSFLGGLELIVSLLRSTDTEVLAAVCAAIAEVAKDRENLGVISDHGVVPLLVNLVGTEDESLRENLARAIAYCCSWGSNCKTFGRLGAITPLVKYMSSDNVKVHRTTALALYHLSKNYFNCVTMHESGVVPFLLKTVASSDKELQDASAGCLGNIRRLALEAESYHLVRKTDGESSDD